MKDFCSSLRMFLWMTLLTGIVYPLLITAIATLTMKEKAAGSFVTSDGKIAGSMLIAQKFTSDQYFWPRPSAVDYNPLPSGGSNFGPISRELKKAVDERVQILVKAHGVTDINKIPSELVFASGSGLDPHITPEAAYFQIERIAKARGLDAEEDKKLLRDLVESMIEKRSCGFLGERVVNVLLLNRALSQMKKTHHG